MTRFFNIDLHISVIEDIRDICKRIDKDIQIEDWSLSGHTWVFGKQQREIHLLNDSNWMNINKSFIKEFIEYHKSYFMQFDGFIVCHPNSFALFYETFDKPVYVINSYRYDLPFCWTHDMDMIKELGYCFQRLQAKGLLHVISNNKADNTYFRLGNPGIHTRVIPSLCLYTNMKWIHTNTTDTFLVYSGTLDTSKAGIVHRSDLGQYTWDSLMKFKGIIHLPYEASTMSIFEQISSGIPLFFPTKRFLKELIQKNQIHFNTNYWQKNLPEYLDLTGNPEYWIERADYYTLEGYYYFDSLDDLYRQLDTFTDPFYETRMQFIEKRKSDILHEYSKIFSV